MMTWNSVFELDLKKTLYGSVDLVVPRNPAKPATFQGKLDGYWRPGSNPRGTRMSAVLFGDTMRAWAVADRLPEWWINPWSTRPLPRPDPFATVTVDNDGNLVRTNASTTGADLFGLSPRWPNTD
jgi:hypothetical protein